MSNPILEALSKGLWETHKEFYRYKKAQERSSSRPSYQPFRTRQVTLSEVVLGVLPEAIKRASGNGALPFSVRQLYYQVRPLIQDYTDKELNYGYFTPPLVDEYQHIHGPIRGLVYDPRGHLIEPHTVGAACSQCGSNLIINTRTWSPIASHRQAVALGTREVAGYALPPYEFNKVLYIEKEGFRDILEAAQLPQRYDIALMTSKGFAVRAARELLYRAQQEDIPILVAHDADIAGYEIARTLAEATRTFSRRIRVLDLGLKVVEALGMGLQTEEVVIKHRPSQALWWRLSAEEKKFFWDGSRTGQRVELNAMTSAQLVSWLEGKLQALGLEEKVLPPRQALEERWDQVKGPLVREMVSSALRQALRELGVDLAEIEASLALELSPPLPPDFPLELTNQLKPNPPEPWRHFLDEEVHESVKGLDTKALARAKEILRGSLGGPDRG